jgi:hypothetical protein
MSSRKEECDTRTSIFTPSLIGWSFAGVPSSPVATFEASLFRGGIAIVKYGARLSSGLYLGRNVQDGGQT